LWCRVACGCEGRVTRCYRRCRCSLSRYPIVPFSLSLLFLLLFFALWAIHFPIILSFNPPRRIHSTSRHLLLEQALQSFAISLFKPSRRHCFSILPMHHRMHAIIFVVAFAFSLFCQVSTAPSTPYGSSRSVDYRRQSSSSPINKPVTTQTVQKTQTCVLQFSLKTWSSAHLGYCSRQGTVTETCTVTLTPVTGPNGESLVKVVRQCTVNVGSNPPPPPPPPANSAPPVVTTSPPSSSPNPTAPVSPTVSSLCRRSNDFQRSFLPLHSRVHRLCLPRWPAARDQRHQ
jgi:hypothetical protein